MQHNKITGADVHVLHAFTYADVTARTGATGFTVEDVGKAALQQSDNTLWALTNHSPITWLQIGTGAPPGPHTHPESDVTGLVADLANKSDVGHTHAEGDITGLTTDLAGKSDVGHTHTEADITGLTTDLAGKADVGHVHDDRYYTETETDTLLANKASSTHTHALDDLSDVSTAGASTGQALVKQADGSWAPGTVSGGGGNLDSLTDVVIASPSSGQVLKYDGTNWVNGTDATGSGGSATPTAAVRQTVLSGRVDSNGFANFIEAGSGLAAVIKGASVPVVVGFANGFDTTGAPVDYFGRITTDNTISGLTASATNYLYATYAAGTVSLVAAILGPTYSSVQPSATVSTVPMMTANNAPSPYVASASSSYSAAFAPWKAFDGVLTEAIGVYNGWATSSGALPQWLNIDLGSAKFITRYSLYGNASNWATAPKDWVIKASNTGAFAGEEVTIDSRSGQTTWTTSGLSFNIASPGSYRYYRLHITANNGSASETDLEEWQLFEAANTGQRWFDLSTMTPKKWDGSAWVVENWCALGEVVTSGSGVTSVTTYALRGQYDSGWFSVSASTNYNKSHNIGVPYPNLTSHLTRKSDGSGPVIVNDMIYSGAYYGSLVRGLDSRNIVEVFAGNPVYWDTATALGTGQYKITLDRGW